MEQKPGAQLIKKAPKEKQKPQGQEQKPKKKIVRKRKPVSQRRPEKSEPLDPGKVKNTAKKQGVVGGKYVGHPSGRERFGQSSRDRTYKTYKSNRGNSSGDNQHYQQDRSGQRQRPQRYGGGANRGEGHTGTSPRPTNDLRSTGTGKRSFKPKKRDGSYKRRDKHMEKEFQVKKKSVELLNPVPKSIAIMEVITVSDLARKMNLKASDLIAKLMGMGMMVTINQQIDAETAGILASEYQCEVKIVSLYDETLIETEQDTDDSMRSRPPVVTVMGHVDHGKTKLLDAIRLSNVIDRESGGITQHIGAYQVKVSDNMVTFLDTPGHEAFTHMRARGAQMTDIVVLVVAANDGVMPQTIEAIHHAQDARVPIIVAINKIDLPEANVERIKQQLADHKLLAEGWGGETMFHEVSALKGEGIKELLEGIILQADVMELQANYNTRAEGRVVESKIDPGRGTVATILIDRGVLKVGDNFLAGVYPGRIRAMFNDHGEEIEEAQPSMPVEITGLSGVPLAGDPFQATETEKQARQVGGKRQELKKMEAAKNIKKITLTNLYATIQEGAIQEVKIIIKGDVQGSVEAIQSSLEKLSTAEIRIQVIHAGAGAINDSDVNLAAVSDAIIIGFHVRPTSRAQILADQEKVEIRKYSIIYDVIEDIRSAMEGMLEPELKEEHVGTVEVRDTFKIPKIGVIAGCFVSQGMVKRNSVARLYREGVEIFNGQMTSLKRFKDNVKEVAQGYECGIGLKDHEDIKEGDIVEVFEMKEVARKLGKTLVEMEKERVKSGSSAEKSK